MEDYCDHRFAMKLENGIVYTVYLLENVDIEYVNDGDNI